MSSDRHDLSGSGDAVDLDHDHDHDHDDRADGRRETANERADRNWSELLQELRVLQTGTQILTGFLLAVAFQPRFLEMDELQRTVYVVLVALAALATVLALAPVGMHRMLFGHRRKPAMVRVAGLVVQAALIVVGTLTVGVTALIIDFTLGRTAGIITLISSLVVVVAVWTALPRVVRARGRSVDMRASSESAQGG